MRRNRPALDGKINANSVSPGAGTSLFCPLKNASASAVSLFCKFRPTMINHSPSVGVLSLENSDRVKTVFDPMEIGIHPAIASRLDTAKTAGEATTECARPRAQEARKGPPQSSSSRSFGIFTLLRPRTGALRFCRASRLLLSRSQSMRCWTVFSAC